MHYFLSNKISATGYETFLTFFPWMSRCQSVAIELTSRYWPGYLPCWDGPLSVRGKEGRGEGMDGLMDGGVGKVEGWQSPRERESGGSWRGPLGPLNWHVQAPGLSWSELFNKTCDNIQYSLTFKRALKSGLLLYFKSHFYCFNLTCILLQLFILSYIIIIIITRPIIIHHNWSFFQYIFEKL